MDRYCYLQRTGFMEGDRLEPFLRLVGSFIPYDRRLYVGWSVDGHRWRERICAL